MLPSEFGYKSPKRVCQTCYDKVTNNTQTVSSLEIGRPTTITGETTPMSVKKPQVRKQSFLRQLSWKPFSVELPSGNTCDSLTVADPEKVGFLLKKGHRRKNWTKRFFLLQQGMLYYFLSETDSPNEGKPKGQITLREQTLHNIDEQTAGYQHCFVLKGKKTFLLRAQTTQDMEEWTTILAPLVRTKGESIISLALLEAKE